jgi:hypothetical protein
MNTLVHPPIYTTNDADLAFIDSKVHPGDPRRYLERYRLRFTGFTQVPIAARLGRKPCVRLKPRSPLAHKRQLEDLAMNVHGIEGATAWERFTVATVPVAGLGLTAAPGLQLADARLVVPLEVFETYAKRRRRTVAELFRLLRDGDCEDIEGEDIEGELRRLVLQSSTETKCYLASPPSRPPPPPPPSPPLTPLSPPPVAFAARPPPGCVQPVALRDNTARCGSPGGS